MNNQDNYQRALSHHDATTLRALPAITHLIESQTSFVEWKKRLSLTASYSDILNLLSSSNHRAMPPKNRLKWIDLIRTKTDTLSVELLQAYYCVLTELSSHSKTADSDLFLKTANTLMETAFEFECKELCSHRQLPSLFWKIINRVYLYCEQKGLHTKLRRKGLFSEIPKKPLQHYYIATLLLYLSDPYHLEREGFIKAKEWSLSAANKVELCTDAPTGATASILLDHHFPPQRPLSLHPEQPAQQSRQIKTTEATLYLKQSASKTETSSDIKLLNHLIKAWSPETGRLLSRISTSKHVMIATGIYSVLDTLKYIKDPASGYTYARILNENSAGCCIELSESEHGLSINQLICLTESVVQGRAPYHTIGIVRWFSINHGMALAGIEYLSTQAQVTQCSSAHSLNAPFDAIYIPPSHHLEALPSLILAKSVSVDEFRFCNPETRNALTARKIETVRETQDYQQILCQPN